MRQPLSRAVSLTLAANVESLLISEPFLWQRSETRMTASVLTQDPNT